MMPVMRLVMRQVMMQVLGDASRSMTSESCKAMRKQKKKKKMDVPDVVGCLVWWRRFA